MPLKEIISDNPRGRYPGFTQSGTCVFDGSLGFVSGISAKITDSGIVGGSISLGSPFNRKSTNSGDVCEGIEYSLAVNTAQQAGYPPYQYSYYVENIIKAEIRWKTYTEPPPPAVSEPPTEPIEYTEPQTPEEPSEEPAPPEISSPEISWIEQQVILQQGFKVPYADYDDISKYGREEAGEDIINALIPDRDRAKRIAKLRIWDSFKDRNIVLDCPNFLMKPGDFAQINLFVCLQPL